MNDRRVRGLLILAIVTTFLVACGDETAPADRDSSTVTPPPSDTASVAEPTPTADRAVGGVTATPTPTATPSPTASPTPVVTCPRPEESEYFGEVSAATLDLGPASQALAELLIEAGESQELFTDPEWRAQINQQIESLRAVGHGLQSIFALDSTAEIHAELALLAEETLTATQLLAQGLDELNGDLIQQSIEHLGNAQERLVVALGLLQDFCE